MEIAISSSVPLIKAVESVVGHRPHVQTCRRWVKKGVRGIRLPALFVDGEYRTSVDAVREFIHATTQARLECPEPAKIEPVKPVVSGRVAAAVLQFNKLQKPRKRREAISQ